MACDGRFPIRMVAENGSTHRAKPMTEFIFLRSSHALPLLSICRIGLVWVAPLPADDEGAAAQHAAALQRLPDGSGRRGAGSRDGERELVQIPYLASPHQCANSGVT
jgi:hypothetical protein